MSHRTRHAGDCNGFLGKEKEGFYSEPDAAGHEIYANCNDDLDSNRAFDSNLSRLLKCRILSN